MNVPEYAVNRLAKPGITDCFGLPGDFAFPFDDAIVNHDSIQLRHIMVSATAALALGLVDP